MSEAGPQPPRRKLQPGLAFMLAVVLSVAILPLGLISVYQTNKVLVERQRLSETSLLDQTQQAVSEGREIIRSAIGAARTLAFALNALPENDAQCSAMTERMALESQQFLFIGFIDEALRLRCASNGASGALDGFSGNHAELTSHKREIFVRPLSFAGGELAVHVTVPAVDENDIFRGTVLISIPIDLLNSTLAGVARDANLTMFDNEGELIATESLTDQRRSILPSRFNLGELPAQGRHTFRDSDREGRTRDFAVVPIVEDTVFALGSWEPRAGMPWLPSYGGSVALYFPILMWLVAVLVAYIGVHRLVIRHVRRLRSWMRLYSTGRVDLETAQLDHAPEELEIVADAFRAMTRRLSENERAQEEDLKEKTLLLREIHHRVKNNLQLIASMMSMQIRAAHSDEARGLLRSVQDRVMALSAIHRYLYLARKLTQVQADKLLGDIIQQLVVVGSLEEMGFEIRLTTDFDPVRVSPDQSVPLSLLATEAAMNAVKYCGISAEGSAWINIVFRDLGDGRVCLSVVNSVPQDGEAAIPDGSGLGSKLIDSFVAQLDGDLVAERRENRFELHVTFALTDAAGETDPY